MLSDIQHVNVMSRADGGPKPFRPENAKHLLTYDARSSTFLLEINDSANPEFRVRISFSQEDIDKAKIPKPTPQLAV